MASSSLKKKVVIREELVLVPLASVVEVTKAKGYLQDLGQHVLVSIPYQVNTGTVLLIPISIPILLTYEGSLCMREQLL